MIVLSMEKPLDTPKLMEFMYSDELFSMINASSSSRTMSTMHGLLAEKFSIHASATSTTLHMASAWYPPFMLGSTISSILEFRINGFACIQKVLRYQSFSSIEIKEPNSVYAQFQRKKYDSEIPRMSSL